MLGPEDRGLIYQTTVIRGEFLDEHVPVPNAGRDRCWGRKSYKHVVNKTRWREENEMKQGKCAVVTR